MDVSEKFEHYFKEAIKNYKIAIALDPEYLPAYNNIASLYLLIEEPYKAISNLQDAEKLSPNSRVLLNNLGVTYYQANNEAFASKYLRRAIAENPGYISPLYNSALIAHRRGDVSTATKLSSKYFHTDSDSAWAKRLANRLNVSLSSAIGVSKSRLREKVQGVEVGSYRDEIPKKWGQAKTHQYNLEEDAFHIYARVNNHSPSNVGANRGKILVLHNNISGVGDAISMAYDVTKGLNYYNLSYKRPILGRSMSWELFHKSSESEIVDGVFVLLSPKNKSKTTGFNLSTPVYKSVNREFLFGSIIEKRSSDSLTFGGPSKFTAGSRNGELRVEVARFYQSWFERTSSRILVARSSFNSGNFGLSFNSNNINSGSRQTVSISWFGQFQWVERLSKKVGDVIFRANAQFADSPLLSMEQFVLGGANSVRGYREYLMSVDNGVNYSLEYRYPLFTGIHRNPLQLAAFVDYGRGWNKNRASHKPQEIYSVGVGLRWSNFQGTEFDIYWGKPLVDDQNNTADDLQSNGVHINFRFELL